jgi:cytochrome P450
MLKSHDSLLCRPLEFNPSRWLNGKSVSKPFENPSYWPFGGGPRTCIGMGFAMMEACLVKKISNHIIAERTDLLMPATVFYEHCILLPLA